MFIFITLGKEYIVIIDLIFKIAEIVYWLSAQCIFGGTSGFRGKQQEHFQFTL